MRKRESQGRKVLPGIWQLNRTTFIVRVQKKDPRTGKKRNLRRMLAGSTRGEAIQVREQLLAGEDPKLPPTPASPVTEISLPTVRSFGGSWLRRKKARGDLSPHAQDRYASALDRLSRAILDCPLDRVTPEMVERWMVASVTPRKGREPEKYAPATVNGWLRVLRAMFNDARRLHGLPTNPAEAVRTLREPRNLEDTNSLTAADLAKLLVALQQGDRIAAMAAWVQALTGLRWGEVSALKWDDLDEQGFLTVRRTVAKGEFRPTTKTGRSRVVALSSTLLKELKAFRKKLGAQKHPGLDSGLMFPSDAGKPLWASRISAALRKAREAAGIEQRFTSHGFRRTVTDLLRQAAVDPVTAKAITGHATDRMREHYSTVRTSDLRDASDRLQALIEPGLRKAPNLTVIDGGKDADSDAKESTEESTGESMG